MSARLTAVACLIAAALASQPLLASTLSERVFRKLSDIYELREADKTSYSD